MLKNHDIYLKDPATRTLINQGVARVSDDKSQEALAVLRYELETFVCDGQYERGLVHILEVFLKNLNQAQQPSVWISGFFGSGKSHLAKMLTALWLDTQFPDGATARGIANLPPGIREHLQELSVQAKRHGGLHAASGTLGSGISDKVRLALLRIVFKSLGLPEHYAVARFVMWLRTEDIESRVRALVEKNGYVWQEELDNFYVAQGLHEALVQVKPQLFSSPAVCVETLNNLYPFVQDVSSDEMIKAMRQALTVSGRFPLTLIVLDEVQQYIGEDSQKSFEVQELVETCSKNFGGKLLLIGTGQTAITGTSNLKKLEGRFTVRVELSDADVEAVIRQVILAKKPEARQPIEHILQTNLGEISRHLAGTTICHRQADLVHFTQDYPILPVRRRFWENTLRVLDQTGTDSQLRNQLSMVHNVIKTNLDASLGHVVAADYLYFDCADRLLQSRILPRKVHERTMNWIRGSEDEKLLARACGLIFLVNKLNSQNREIGIRATIDTLSDLLVEDLSLGSGALRGRLPQLLNSCDLLIKVSDEYRIQTEESAAWTDDFLSQRVVLSSESHRIESERDDRIRKRFSEQLRKLALTQGNSKVSRELHLVFEPQLPVDSHNRLCVWVRDGWNFDENSVRADARQAGNQSPTVFVFLPKRSGDDLRHHLIDFKAASATLEQRGVSKTPESQEAQEAMVTIQRTAEQKIQELLAEAFSKARVFQGGGVEVLGNNLSDMILEASRNSLQRLFPQFAQADDNSWSKVYEKAQKGAPDALKALGFDDIPAKHSVCKAILSSIGSGKKGVDIRAQFEATPYGWSRDAIDGGLQVLLVAGLVLAHDERGQVLEPKNLERKALGKVSFKVESATVSTQERIQIRKLFQAVSLTARQGDELAAVPQYLQTMFQLAHKAGGDAPKPMTPDTGLLEEIRRTSGNEQLRMLYNRREEFSHFQADWQKKSELIANRLPNWEILLRLKQHASTCSQAYEHLTQIQVIEQQRQLLSEPDPVVPLLANLTHVLRTELNQLKETWEKQWRSGFEKLKADSSWNKLNSDQQTELRSHQQLLDSAVPRFDLESAKSVLATLDTLGLGQLRDRIAALPKRFDDLILAAARLLEPEAQRIVLPTRALKSPADVESWLQDSRTLLLEKIKEGPVLV